MTDESVFRFIAIISIVLTLPIGLYHRIRSQATEREAGTEGRRHLHHDRLAALRAPCLDRISRLFDQSILDGLVLGRPCPHGCGGLGAFVSVLVVPPLLFWTFHSLGKNLTDTVVTRREHTLVTHGPYRWVRHPFYDIVLLWIVSLSLLTANWLLALLGVSAFAMMVVRTLWYSIEEEKHRAFGDEYRSLLERTGDSPHVTH